MANTSGTKRTGKPSKPPGVATGAEEKEALRQLALEAGEKEAWRKAALDAALREILDQRIGDEVAPGRVASGDYYTLIVPRMKLRDSKPIGSGLRRIFREMTGGDDAGLDDQVGGVTGGGDAGLDDLLEREAEQFRVAAGRVAALAGTAVEAAKAGNDRIEANNARLKAALEAFQNRA